MDALSVATDLPRVRFAGPEDEDRLIAMVRDLHSESGLRDAEDRPLPLDEGKVRALVQSAVLRSSNGLGPHAIGSGAGAIEIHETHAGSAGQDIAGHAAIGVIGPPQRIEGSVYLSVETTWYSRAPVVVEIWNYVPPAFRRSQHAKTLISFSKAVATVLGLPLVMAVMSTERQQAKMRFYERNLGCRPFGATYVYTPPRAALFS